MGGKSAQIAPAKTATIRAFALPYPTRMNRSLDPANAPFIEGSIWRHLINMTCARSVGILATFIVDFVDILFISRLGDARLIAGLGFAAAALYFIRAIAIALGITTTVLVARAIGGGDRHRAARYAWDTSAFSFILLTLLAAIAWFARVPILAALGAQGETLAHAADYLAIVLIGLPLLTLGNCGTSTLFALGSARLAMYVSIGATATQAVLDPIFIFVCGWGLRGAALAALISQAVLVAAAWYVVIWRYRLRAPLCLRLLMLNIPAIVAIAVPAMLTNLTSPLATAFAARQMAAFGDDAVAAFAVIIRLVPVGFALLFSLSAAVAPIIGQNAGAARFARVRQTLLAALQFNWLTVAAIGLLLFLLREPLPQWFALDERAAALLRFYCSGASLLFGCKGVIFFLNAAYNNLGRPFYSTASNLAGLLFGAIPLISLGAWLLGPRGIILGHMAEAAFTAPVCWLIAMRLVARYEAGMPLEQRRLDDGLRRR